jgi:hypothetical protein
MSSTPCNHTVGLLWLHPVGQSTATVCEALSWCEYHARTCAQAGGSHVVQSYEFMQCHHTNAAHYSGINRARVRVRSDVNPQYRLGNPGSKRGCWAWHLMGGLCLFVCPAPPLGLGKLTERFVRLFLFIFIQWPKVSVPCAVSDCRLDQSASSLSRALSTLGPLMAAAFSEATARPRTCIDKRTGPS